MTQPREPSFELPPAPGRAIREVPLAERPRERLALRGVGGLTSAELIGLVWGSGTRGRSAVDIAADALVLGPVHRQEDPLRAEPERRPERHGRMHAEPAGFVAGCADDAARSRVAADDHRLAAQLGAVALLHRGEEGVEVDVDDVEAAAGHA